MEMWVKRKFSGVAVHGDLCVLSYLSAFSSGNLYILELL